MSELNHVKMVLRGQTRDLGEVPVNLDLSGIRQRLWLLPDWLIPERIERVGDTAYVFVEFKWWRAMGHLAFWRYLAGAMVHRLVRR